MFINIEEVYNRSFEDCVEEWKYVEDIEHLIFTYEEPAWNDMYGLEECNDIWDIVWYFEFKYLKDKLNEVYYD